MRKNFGAKTWLYPMPVLMVSAYDEEGKPCCMNAAWGGIYDTDQIMICLDEGHKTTKSIVSSGAFTVGIADEEHVLEADFVGIVSGNDDPCKMEKAGLTCIPSEFVSAPVVTDFPMTLECELIKFNEDGICIGRIVNVSAEERILDEKGNIDPARLRPITYDPVGHRYMGLGKVVGRAFYDGKGLK